MPLTQLDMLRKKHETMWVKAIQQEDSRLKPYVTIKPGAGNGVEIPYLGKLDLREYSDYYDKIEWSHLKHDKRTIKRRMFTSSVPISSDVKIDMHDLSLSVSDITAEQRKAYGRVIDEVILGVMLDPGTGKYRIRKTTDGVCGGALSANYTGNDGATISELDLSKGSKNVIPSNAADGATAEDDDTPLVIRKIGLLRTKYMQMDAWNAGSSDDIVVAISPLQYLDMLQWEQTQRRDYGFQCLKDGKVNEFLQCKILITNALPADEKGLRLCVGWLKSRLVFAPWNNGECRVAPREDYTNVRAQVTFQASCGATRLDDDTLFVIPCKEPDVA